MKPEVVIKFIECRCIELKISLFRHAVIFHFDDAVAFKFFTLTHISLLALATAAVLTQRPSLKLSLKSSMRYA